LFDQLLAVLRHRRHVVPQARQVTLEELAGIGLVVGDGDA
jgi:hypothetical protein